MIVPAETELTAPYWEGARAGELRLQWCLECDRCWHPPSPVCPSCRGGSIEWRACAGRGVVHSFTIAEHAAHPAFADRLPYAIVLVALDEGPLMIANLLSGAHDAIRIGMEVQVVFEQIEEGVVLPQFTPRSATVD